MTSMSWWRSWHGAPTDHKWAVIAARSGVKTGIVSAVAWALFDYASQNAERGSVAGFDPEEYAVYSGFDEGEIIAVIQAMTDKGIITDGTLTNWKKRQPEREDYSTPRVTKYRELKRNVTQCNAPDKITESDTDTDIDTELELDTEADAKFRNLQRTIETKTGCLMTPLDIPAVDEMLKAGATEADIEAAVCWYKDNGKVITQIRRMTPSVRFAISKRTQASAKKDKSKRELEDEALLKAVLGGQ